jgi:uncharacterized FlgJ-related protein
MGMNSVETIAKVPTAMDATASQAERVAGTGELAVECRRGHRQVVGARVAAG